MVHRRSDSSPQKFTNFWLYKFLLIKNEKFPKKRSGSTSQVRSLSKVEFWRKKIHFPGEPFAGEVFQILQKRIFEKNYILTVSYYHVKNWWKAKKGSKISWDSPFKHRLRFYTAFNLQSSLIITISCVTSHCSGKWTVRMCKKTKQNPFQSKHFSFYTMIRRRHTNFK